MIKVLRKENICEGDLKCISTNPLAVGGNAKLIKLIGNGTTFLFDAKVSSLVPYRSGLVFGLSDGKLGFLDRNGQRECVDLHKSNICTLDVCGESILTGSWDHSAILLQKSSANTQLRMGDSFYHVLVLPHPETVWSARFITENELVTGCADKKLRIFSAGVCTKEIDYHNSVVRGVIVSEDLIYSVDNYGTVIKTSKSGKILRSRFLEEICFCICAFEDHLLVGGDNGSVFVLNRDLEVLEKIKLPCLSCWSIAVRDDDVLVAGSNGVLYYLQRSETQDSSEVDASNSGDRKDGIFVANGLRYKMEAGKVYIENGNEWELMGDAEKAFDHSFSVELGNKEYVLSFNDEDNVHEVASKFIHENGLDWSHHQEIVNYINHTFRRSTLYKKYDTIDIKGISRVVGSHPILEVLRKVADGEKFSMFVKDSQNVYQIEKVLFRSSLPLFVVLDVCKFLCFKKINLDLSFLFNSSFQDRKEAKAFAYLMTNIVEEPHFNISALHRKLRRLKDLGYLTDDDTFRYEENFAIKNRSS